MRVFDAPPARATRGRTREIVHRPAVVRPAFERASDDSASEDSGEDSDASSGEEIDDRGVADAREGDRARSGDGSNLVSVSGAGEGRQVVVVGADGVARGVWRAVLYPERGRADAEAEESASEAFRRVIEERDKPWVVVLARGGRFAASAFDVRELGAAGDAPAAAATRHATASRYVVRAKAGGRQVSKDAGGKNIKSAGSSMRRQNEAALEADMRQTFTQWRDVIEVRRFGRFHVTARERIRMMLTFLLENGCGHRGQTRCPRLRGLWFAVARRGKPRSDLDRTRARDAR